MEYGSYQIWNESKIAKEEESDCDSNNETLEATNVWQKMAKKYVKNLAKKASDKAKIIDYLLDCGNTQISIFLHRQLQPYVFWTPAVGKKH